MIINFSNLGGGGGGSQVQVIDNLNSTSSSAALSAKQGKVLNEKKADTTAVTESINNAVSGLASTKYVDNAVSGKADTSAVTEEISAAVSGLASTQYVDNAVSGKADTSAVTESINNAVSGLASTQYVDNSVSGKADTSAVTESINNAVSGLASTQYVDNSVSGKADTSAVTESISNALTSYTPTSGFATINGSAITEGGNIEIQGGGGGDSTALEEITELPENPVDGAVYNYNGTLVRYVDGPGNWGQWVGLNSMTARTQSTLGSVTLFYGVFPESMDGERIFTVSTMSQTPHLSGFLNLTNNTIDVYNNTSKTGSTVAVINLNATSETTLNLWLSTNATASWKNNVLQIRSGNESTIIEYWCPISASTGHYELAEPRSYNYPLTRTSRTWSLQSYGVIFDEKTGMVNPGVPLNDSNRIIYVNASGSTNALRFYGPVNSPISRMYVPTSSGATGTLCVSNGGDSAPSFKTVTQALGVDFAVLTQDEYDALDPNAGGTGYTATRLYFIKDE